MAASNQNGHPFLPPEVTSALADGRETLKGLRRSAQGVASAVDQLDFRQLRGRLPALLDELGAARSRLQALQGALDAFHLPETGPGLAAYAASLEEAARQVGLTLRGTFPAYSAFPVELRVDPAQEQVFIGRKRSGRMAPVGVVKAVLREQNRLHRSSFNAKRFQTALVKAYDFLLPGHSGKGDVLLRDIYRILTLRSGPSEYSRQAFAFDIYRLRRQSDLREGDRMLQFGHNRRFSFEVPNGRGGVDNISSLSLVTVRTGD